MSHFKQGKVVHRTNSTTSSGGTLTLTNLSARFQQITGTQNHTVVLPDATTLPKGFAFIISNRSTGTVTVNFNGGSLAKSLTTNTQATFDVFDNVSAPGDWDISNEAASGGGASLSTGDKLSALSAISDGLFKDSSNTTAKLALNPEEVGADVWITKSSRSGLRYYQEGFALNGYGYFAGGIVSGPSISQTNERYDETNNYWITRASTLDASTGSRQAAFTLNGFGYLALGSDAGGVSMTNATQQYNDVSNSWSTISTSPSPTAYGFCNGVTLGGYGFAGGGRQNGSGSVTNINQMYNDASTAWTQRTVMSNARYSHHGDVLNDAWYVVDGDNSGGSDITSVEKFNYVLNTWSSAATSSTRRTEANVLSVGGFLNANGNTSEATSLEQYYDLGNYWSTKASTANGHGYGRGFSINGAGYTISSSGNATVEQYKNFSYMISSIVKKSSLTPSAIYISSAIKDLVPNLPIQLRTDGDSWKNLTANSDSSLKQGENLKAKFRETGVGSALGGATTYNVGVTNAETYSDIQNVWNSRASLTVGKCRYGSFALNSYVYVFAGTDNTSTVVNTNYQFNDITNSWATKAAYTDTIRYAAGFSLDGYGYSGTGFAYTSNFYQYNDSLDSWASKTSTPVVRGFANGDAGYGVGYIYGGDNNAGGSPILVYNPISNAWTNTSINSNTQDSDKGGFFFNGLLYQGGGNNGVSITSSFEMYNPVTNSESNKTSLNTAITGPSGFRSSGFGYFAGGGTSLSGSGSPTALTQQFNDAANSWTNKANLNTAREDLSRGSNPTPGIYRNYEVRVGIPAYIAGAGAGVWVSIANFPLVGSDNPGNFALNGYVYTVGGRSGGTPQTDTYRYSDVTKDYKKSFAATSADGEWPCGSVGGFGYASTGTSSSGNTMKFDDQTGWTAKTNSGIAENSVVAGVLNSFFYLMGGNPANTRLKKYDTNADSWTSKTAANIAMANGGVHTQHGFMYNSSGTTNQATQQYDDASDSWVTKSTPNVDQYDPAVFVISDFGYLAGSASPFSATAEKYNDFANTWTTIASLPSSTYGNNTGAQLNGSGYAIGMNGGGGYALAFQFVPSLNNIVLGAGLRVTES